MPQLGQTDCLSQRPPGSDDVICDRFNGILFTFSIETIDTVVNKLTLGKESGPRELSLEDVPYAHHVLLLHYFLYDNLTWICSNCFWHRRNQVTLILLIIVEQQLSRPS